VVAETWIVRRMRPMAKAGKMLAEMTSFMITDPDLFEVLSLMLLLTSLRKAKFFFCFLFWNLSSWCVVVCLLMDGRYEGVNFLK
jgi:hypothetical protein